ncbi:hypothetical protein SLINC_7392 [Streptomyces lincolnensis]|uniref:Uncharacterized protein n=1 Tax=Streptomyces lincolnensis TaxID=1915 RepID=A0A1B1MLZ0_STRLN|nr:HEAT repeat domain-containing protein [Streptomyces lincolnensis]ANS69616.1 hypothetical protein SLINC_7392 [Streptomyces lincolnensis]AXG58535.1 hypothetical protein SLCG_7380 [Streptomyces lincolnensis]QMV11171.1 hypothetical protein GJU35_39505 [Streptomyces lincolnensis]
MRVVELSAEALDTVPWERLESADPNVPAKEVRRVMRRLVRKGPESTDRDCWPLFSALAGTSDAPSALTTAVVPFVVALAADPRTGARSTLVELMVFLFEQSPAGAAQPEVWRHAHHTAQDLLADPEPVVRRAALSLADGPGRLLDRWRDERDPAVRIPLLLALGEFAAETEVRTLLTGLLRDADPVLRVTAVHALAGREPEIAVRELDALVEILADPALRPRWEGVWYIPDADGALSRENIADWTAALFETVPVAATRFVTRLAGAADPVEDADLLRAVVEHAWRLLVSHRSAEGALLPVVGRLLDHSDATVRLTSAHFLGAAGPRARAYADRLAGLLDDPGEGELLDGTVGEHARWALARMDDPRALPGLVESLCTPHHQELGRSWAGGGPRRPEVVDVLGPLRAHADLLLPAVREELRRDGPYSLRSDLLDVVRAWGPDALPALPEVTACLADMYSGHSAGRALAALGPAAASAATAVRERIGLDPPGNHPWWHWILGRIGGGDPAQNLRVVGETLPREGEPASGGGMAGHLADFGAEAAPYADRLRYLLTNGEGWVRTQAAVALWPVTGERDPARSVLEEEILAFTADREYYGMFDTALRALIRMGPLGPTVRTALHTLREQDRRLSAHGDYRAILDDETRLALIDEALSLKG